MNPLTNFAISAPITLVFAYLSWHLIEKPALKLKHKKLITISNRNKAA